VDDTLRDALAVEVRELLEQELVLDEHRPADARGLAVLVVGDRSPGLRGQGGVQLALSRHQITPGGITVRKGREPALELEGRLAAAEVYV
jgi:hypothetical protein